MSKNHPHDNIYSILGKLAKLEAKDKPAAAPASKAIYESVESQGSILKGLRKVSAIESRLAEAFAKDNNDEHCKECGMFESKCACDHNNESKCNECGMFESKCACDHTNKGLAEDMMLEDDELYKRGGINSPNRKPRRDQTDFSEIPGGNYPGTTNPYSDEHRRSQPERLKRDIKASLGKHPKPNLPESMAEGINSIMDIVTPALHDNRSLDGYVSSLYTYIEQNNMENDPKWKQAEQMAKDYHFNWSKKNGYTTANANTNPELARKGEKLRHRALIQAVAQLFGQQGVAEGLNEFSQDNDSREDGPGEDPYKRPKPKEYARSGDFFEKFEADHFDHEDFDDATGTFKGYWGSDQIAGFKFDDPSKTGSDDPGMGWYYEPQNEGVEQQGANTILDIATRASHDNGPLDGYVSSLYTYIEQNNMENDPKWKQAEQMAKDYHFNWSKKNGYTTANANPELARKGEKLRHRALIQAVAQLFGQQGVAEMDKSQTPPGRAGDYPLGVKGTTGKPVTAKRVVQDLTKYLDQAFSKEKKVKEAGSPAQQAAIAKKKKKGVAEGLAQDEAEESSGWRAEFVNEINYNTFEVKVTNARSKESANFIIRPVDMISMGPTLDIETMDVRDLQTGQTESWTKDDPAPDGPIANAIGSLFYDDKQLQKKLHNIIDTHSTKGQDMMPGLKKRRSIGQEVDADAYIDAGEKTQAAMAKMKKGMAEGSTDELHADLSDKYNELAPGIEKYKDEKGADHLYKELLAIARHHGAEREFSRMCNGARNSAHMDYDTNPGHFKNWFWYLGLGNEQDLPEGETTHEPDVTKHRKTDYPGYPTDDTLEPSDGPGTVKRGRPLKAQTKNPRRDPNAPKLGRGRPKKDTEPVYSKMNDPFGRVPSKAPKSKVKGRVHSMDEAMSLLDSRLHRINEGINLVELLKSKHQTVDEMLSELQQDIKQFKDTGHCSELLKDCMEIKGYHGKMVADESADPSNPFYDPKNDYNLPPSMRGHGTPDYKLPDTKAHDNRHRDDYRNRTGLPPMDSSLEEELNELAKLAGLGEVSRSDYIKQQDAEAERAGENKFNAFGQLFKTDEVNEEDLEEDKIDVKDAPDAVNKPRAKYYNIKSMLDGDDLNRRKTQDPHTANRAANPFTTTPTLESQLAAEYESIKKSIK